MGQPLALPEVAALAGLLVGFPAGEPGRVELLTAGEIEVAAKDRLAVGREAIEAVAAEGGQGPQERPLLAILGLVAGRVRPAAPRRPNPAAAAHSGSMRTKPL